MAVIFVTSKAADFNLITVLLVYFVFWLWRVYSYMFWAAYGTCYGVPLLRTVNFVTSFARCPYFPEL